MLRLNNLQKFTAALILLIFVVEIIAAPVSVHAQQSSGSSTGQTAVFATLGAVAAGVAAFCIAQAVSEGKIFGSGIGKTFQCSVTNPPGVHLLSADGLKKWIFDPAARIIIRALLQATTQQIVSWIQGNGGKNVGYVKNLEAALRHEADAAGGEFLNNLTGINLCGNIGAFLQITLRTPGLRQRLECTVTDIVRNLDNFYRDFQQGGWPAFIRVSLEPQNNPYGAYMIALDAKISAEASRQQGFLEPLKKSFPFEGFKVAVPKRCYAVRTGSSSEFPEEGALAGRKTALQNTPEGKNAQGLAATIGPLMQQTGPAPLRPIEEEFAPNQQGRIEDLGTDQARIEQARKEAAEEAARKERERIIEVQPNFAELSGGLSPQQTAVVGEKNREDKGVFCVTEFEYKTPGTLIADGLSKATFGGLDFAWSAKEFDEAISVIINALINKLVTSTFAGSDSGTSGQGLFDSGFNNLPREDLTESVIAKRINDGLFMADAALALADAALLSERRDLFAARKQLEELKRADPSGTSAEIPALQSKISSLQTSIATSLEVKKRVLFSQYDLLLMKRSLAASATPSEIQRVAQDLPIILLRLGDATSRLGALPASPLSSGSNKGDLLEMTRGTKNNLTNALAMVDDTGKEVERVLAGGLIDSIKRQELTLARAALLTQRGLLQNQLDAVVLLEKDAAKTDNQDRIRDLTNDLVKRLFTLNQLLEQTGDIFVKIDASLKQ
ncbi:MAG: hypothetical protein HYW91_03150 [Candidatus Sungbacteria bacterium]|nr:hypothetical protein [Candidatus Sungbacteria bacterium]